MTFASILEATGMSAVPVLLFIKATCLLLAALAATFVMMRASSGARHLVWLVVLSALLVLPVIATWSPLRLEVLPHSLAVRGSTSATPVNSPVGKPSAGQNSAPTTQQDASLNALSGAASGAAARELTASERATGKLSNQSSPAAAPDRSAPTSGSTTASTSGSTLVQQLSSALRLSTRTVGETVLVVWLAVSAALLGWLAYGAYSVRRIVRRSQPLEDPAWQTPLYEIADRFQLADAPRLVRSEDVRMPFACGVLHPTIVLPAEADAWSADRRSAVLLHELGHVQRRDLIGHTLGRVACALYWFHPLVWTAARRLRAESERACDDLALSCGARPSDYAEHLLDIVTCVRNHATPSIALAMAHRKEFEGRMLAILNPELERTRPSRRQSLSLVGALALLCIVVSAAAPVADAKSPSPGLASREANNDGRRDGARDVQDSVDKGRVSPDRDAGVTVKVHQGMSTVTSVVTNTQVNSRTSTNDGITANSQTPATGNDGALALELIGERALKSLGSIVSSALSASATATAQALGQGAQASQSAQTAAQSSAQAKDDERPALLAKVLRTDTSSALRRIAAWGLHEYANEEVAVDALVAAVDRDNNAAVREMAAWSLSESKGSDRVVTALMSFSKRETDPKARATALWTLATLGSDNAMDAMSSALSSDNAHVREIAIWGIGNISPPHAPAPVLAALSDKEPRVRLLAAWALYNMQDENAVTALDAQLRRETDRDVQRGLVRAIASTGEKSVSVLKTLIESKDEELRSTAIRALAGAGSFSPWPWPWPDPRPFP